MKFDWLSLGGRKFSIVVFCLLVATIALFFKIANFVQWAAYTITVITGYGVINHQAKKLEQ